MTSPASRSLADSMSVIDIFIEVAVDFAAGMTIAFVDRMRRSIFLPDGFGRDRQSQSYIRRTPRRPSRGPASEAFSPTHRAVHGLCRPDRLRDHHPPPAFLHGVRRWRTSDPWARNRRVLRDAVRLLADLREAERPGGPAARHPRDPRALNRGPSHTLLRELARAPVHRADPRGHCVREPFCRASVRCGPHDAPVA